MTRKITLAAVLAAALFALAPVHAQVIVGGGGTGGSGCTMANPTATIGASAVNGSASTCMRSDGAPALPATLPAVSGANLTNLNGSNIASGTVPAARGGAGTSNGILKANGSGTVSAAASGTDYAPATSGSSVLAGNGSGGFQNVTAGACLSYSSNTLAGTYTINAQTGTTYTVLSSDACKLVTFSNASAVAVTLPQATGSFAAGFAFDVQNKGAGAVTITPTTSTINGGATLVVNQNTGCSIVSDGTNYQVSACTAIGASSGTVTSVGASVPGGFSISGSPVTTSGTLAITANGTSGGVPYYSGTTTMASSGALAANALVIGGGAGAAPSTTTTGTGVLTALGANTDTAGAFSTLIAKGTSALGTSAISSGTCATVVTTTATGTATTDVIMAGFNGDPTGVTGYAPATAGMLTIISYPSANNVNFKVCNNTSSSVTPGAITLNWRVIR